MAKSVSQIEYDVTSYRNVLDQLKTLQDVLKSLNDGLIVYLAINIGSNARRSGYVMEKFDVPKKYRDKAAWSRYVGSIIGLGAISAHHRNVSNVDDPRALGNIEGDKQRNAREYGYRFLTPTIQDKKRWHNFLKKKADALRYKATVSELRRRVYDVMNITRSLQWELNRLRIEAPYDLRQLTSALNRHASTINDPVYAVNIFIKSRRFEKEWIPKMLSVIRERIKKAELEKQVAEENQRRESEQTKKEPAAQQNEKKTTASKTDPQWAAPQITQEQLAKKVANEMAKENDTEIETMAKEQGDNTGGNRGAVTVAGLLALLALTGAG